MLSSDTQTTLLQQYPMLQTLPAPLLAQLFEQARHIQLAAGTVVFDEHQPCQGFPLILAGQVRVSKSSPNGRELQLYRVTAGESCILTSSCLMGHAPYQAHGVVEENLETVIVPSALFRQLLAVHEPFRDYIFSLFADRLTDLMLLVSAVAFQKLDQRLAALLTKHPSPIHITHQALADELGSVREIVSRLLKHFAEQGWIKLSREQIEVLQPTALKKYAAM